MRVSMRRSSGARLNEPAVPWSGTLYTAPMVTLFRGVGGETSAQQRPVHTVVVAPSRVGAVPAGERHRIDLQGDVLVAFLDARRFSWSSVGALLRRWAGATPASDIACLLEDASRVAPPVLDRRALQAVELFAGGSSLPDAARRLAVSPSRLTHLVTSSLGAPPRAWRSWMRLRDGIDHLLDDGSATNAAYHAGFADSAHFSRACRVALGIPPSALRRVTHERVETTERCSRAVS